MQERLRVGQFDCVGYFSGHLSPRKQNLGIVLTLSFPATAASMQTAQEAHRLLKHEAVYQIEIQVISVRSKSWTLQEQFKEAIGADQFSDRMSGFLAIVLHSSRYRFVCVIINVNSICSVVNLTILPRRVIVHLSDFRIH